MIGAIPPILVTLVAETKEFNEGVEKAETKLKGFGATAETTGSKFSGFMSKASTAVIGAGLAFAGVAVDQAYKFQESLDKIQNQAGLTAEQTDKLGKSIINISNQTGVSAEQISAAALTVEQTGIRGARATQLLDVASKAAVITNSSVADTTKAVIAAQTLHITKGMSLAKVMDALVAGSKHFVGGLQAEESMLSGRVGVALANYGLKLGTITALGAEFSKAGLPSRSVVSFGQALGTLEKPMTDSKGKFTSYAQNIQKAGLNLNKLVSDAKTGDVVGILTQIKDVAKESGAPLSQIANLVFGTSAGASASVLINNLKQVADIQKQMTGSGKGSLNASFATAMTQLGPQLNLLKTQLTNLMIGAGQWLLPKAATVVRWANDLIGFFKKHPILGDIASGAAITAFTAAVTAKLISGIKSVISVFQGTTQTALLTEIAANTATMAGEGGANAASGLLGKATAVGKGAAVGVGGSLAIMAAGGLLLQYMASHGPTYAQETKQQRLMSRGPMGGQTPSKPKSGGGKVTLKVK